MAYAILPLDTAVDAGAFRCGQPQLDDYFRRYAAQDQRRGIAVTWTPGPWPGYMSRMIASRCRPRA
jgi:hypothetical protein